MIKTPLSTMIGGAGIWTPSATTIGILGASKTLNQIIKSMFANNEQGFAYDPNDLSTMYQDLRGTPITSAVQPLGLLLDVRNGATLGNELITNGNFAGGITGWSSINGTDEVVSGGYLNFINAATSNPNAGQAINLSPRKFYKVSFRIANFIAGGIYVVFYSLSSANNTMITQSGNGVFTAVLDAPFDTNGYFGIRTTAALATLSLTDISVKEIAGNHAFQTTSSMRPLLQNTPRRVAYDAVDDKLTTNLPAQLTGCTVIRSIPNVGTQILINQTIPTPYNDSTNHCGLIVINRALTASETTQITKLFNKAAGV